MTYYGIGSYAFLTVIIIRDYVGMTKNSFFWYILLIVLHFTYNLK